MEILRGLARGILLLLVSAALAAWIWIATLQATLLNRDTVKRWLANSGIYEVAVGTLIKPATIGDDSQLDTATVQKAIDSTLPPDFIKTNTETAIDATFNWLYGDAQSVDFAIDATAKRDELQQNLAKELETQLQSLPACQSGLSSQTAACIPAGQSAQTAANAEARRNVESSDFLAAPITPETVGQFWQPPSLESLRGVAQNMSTLLLVLPGAAAVLAIGYVFLTPSKLQGLRNIGRRIFFGTIFTTTGGGLLWYFGSQITVGSSTTPGAADFAVLAQPLLRQAVPEFGMWLCLYSGCVLAASGLAWLIAFLLMRHSAAPPHVPPQTHTTHQLPPVTPPTPPTTT